MLGDQLDILCTQWYANYLKSGREDAACDEIVNRRPAWKDGSWRPAPGQEELGFRKLFRMTLQNDFFARKAKHEKVNHCNKVCQAFNTNVSCICNTDRSYCVSLVGQS